MLASEVNGGNPYQGIYFKLSADIALQGPWTPIGSQVSPFSGFFDGDGKKAGGLAVDMTEAGDVDAGLFGAIGASSRIGNLAVEGSVQAESTFGTVNVGIVVGYAHKETLA